MTQSQPKSSSLIAIGFFAFVAIAVAVWLILELIQNPSSYFALKLILAPLLMVIGLIVSIKSFSSAVILSVGDNKLIYRHLIGSEKKFKISEVANWQEEVVKRKNSDYRRLSIQLSNSKKLQLSNHENTNYDQVISYLKKKVKNRK